MIVENRIAEYGYAITIVADAHKEYPLCAPADILWDPFTVESVSSAITQLECDLTSITSVVFGDLPSRYNGDYDWPMTLWRIQGSPFDISRVYHDLIQQLMGGPAGADDDTFDYWPNAFDMAVVIAKDLIAMGYEHPNYIITQIRRVIDSAIALCGPTDEWEADNIMQAIPDLEQCLTAYNEEKDIIDLNNEGKEAL